MQTKLTLRIDDELIRRAKAWAASRGVSLSQVVADVLSQIPSENDESLTPWTRHLIGAGGPVIRDERVRDEVLDRLEAKHR